MQRPQQRRTITGSRPWWGVAAFLLAGAGLWLTYRLLADPGSRSAPLGQEARDQGPQHEYLPLSPGNIWVYQVDDPARGSYKERFEFAGVQEIEGRSFALIVHTNERDRNYRSESLFTHGPAGLELYRVTTAVGELASSLRLGEPKKAMLTLPLELAAGRRWEQELEAHSTLTDRAMACRVRGEVIAEESVQAPAGIFQAWKVKVTQRLGNEETETIGWYAYQVGQVQFEQRRGEQRVVHRLLKALVNGRHFPKPPDELASAREGWIEHNG